MAASEARDPNTLYLYTSLTSGSSTIITATSKLEHWLKAYKIPFKAIDTATDEFAKRVWRRAGGKPLPGLVRDGVVLGNFKDVEEWVEYGELKQQLGLEGKPVLAQGATSSTIPGDKSIAERVKPAATESSNPTTEPVSKASGTSSTSTTTTTTATAEKPPPASASNPVATAMSGMAAEVAAAAAKKKADANKSGK